jgi:glycosyltransferase involved in cell wall biosynthesis
MPTVFVNGRFLSQSMTGVQRFALQMLRAIDRRLACGGIEEQWVILAPCNAKPPQDLTHIQTRVVGRLTGHLWDQIQLPVHAWGGALFSFCNVGPIIHRRHSVAMHDAAIFANPKTYSLAFRMTYWALQPTLARTAKRLLTVSAFSRDELARYCRVSPDRFEIVFNGADHILQQSPDASVLATYGLESKRYVFAVGSVTPNKNFRAVVEAYRRLGRPDLKLAVAGGQNAKVFAGYDFADLPGVVRLGYVTDEALRALYENALCFVFPSLYEGFGIPPLEAMLCGCPVVVSTAPAVKETCGDAALYAAPDDHQGLARQVARLASEPALWQAMQEAGLARAAHFTWDASAQKVLRIAQALLRS